jgi:rRNA maturation endonuclease Nob1
MMRQVITRQLRLHLPLTSVALCLDCEECFELGTDQCPACGSETWTPLARFLAGRERRDEAVCSLAS